MLTEYIYENKKYENAVRDLKATLFDIIAMEEIKLSNMELEIESEFDSFKREELERLCAEQSECLKNTLRVTNELTDSLMRLDSYSKNLKQLTSESVSEDEAITTIDKEAVNSAYENDLGSAASEMINSTDGLEVGNADKGHMVEDVQAIQPGDDESSLNSSNDSQIENENTDLSKENDGEYQDGAMNSTVALEDLQTDNMGITGTEVSLENEMEDDIETGDSTDEEDSVEDENAADEVNLPSVDTPATSEVEGENVSGEVSLPSVDASVTSEVEESTDEEVSVEGENVSGEVSIPSVDTPATSEVEASIGENVAAAEPETDVNQAVALTDVVDETISLPIIDEARRTEVQSTPTPSAPSNIVSNSVDNQAQITNSGNMNTSEKMIFVKSNNDAVRAILTTKKQITKLRESKGTQKALLSVRGVIYSNPVASNTVETVENALDDEKITEQQLIANGLLEATYADKQKQIEVMLEQANNLYKEGKAAEAQAMYDQISVLNKELQATGNVASK